MSKLSSYTIPFGGLSVGDHSFTFDYTDTLFGDTEEGGILGGSGTISIDMLRHASFMELSVRIDGSVTLQCDRCLDPFVHTVAYSGDLLVKFSDTPAEYDGDIIWLQPGESQLDLGDWLYESIVLSLPIQRIHPDLGHCNAEVVKHITGHLDAEDLASEEE